MTELLREICLAFQNAVPLRVRPVVTQFSFGREEAFPLFMRYGDYRWISVHYPRSYDHPGLLARRDREREIGDFRCLDRIMEQHL